MKAIETTFILTDYSFLYFCSDGVGLSTCWYLISLSLSVSLSLYIYLYIYIYIYIYMGPRTWNPLSSELYTNSAHQTLIHISGFSSRFRRAVTREYSDWLIYYMHSPVFPWVGLGEACGWVGCFSVAMYDHVSRVFCPVLLYLHYYLYLLLSKLWNTSKLNTDLILLNKLNNTIMF